MKRQGIFPPPRSGFFERWMDRGGGGWKGRGNDKKNGRRNDSSRLDPRSFLHFHRRRRRRRGGFETRNVPPLQRRDSQADRRTDGRERKGKGKVKVRRKIYSSRNLIGRVIYRVGPKTSFPSRSFYRVHPNIKRFLSFFKGVIK